MTTEILIGLAVGWALSWLYRLEVRPGRRERDRILAEIEALDAQREKQRELERVEHIRAIIRQTTA